MSLTMAAGDLSMQKDRSDWPRVGGVALLGVLELLAVTVRYDSESLVGQGWIGTLAAASRSLPQILLVVFTAFIVVRNAATGASALSLAERDSRSIATLARLLAIQLASFAAFFLITGQIIANEDSNRGIRVAAWLLTASAAGVSAALLAYPAGTWLAFF